MSISQIINDFHNLQTGIANHVFEVPAEEHLAVSVRHRREIDACLRQVERGCVKPLPVPQCLHDKYLCISSYALRDAGQYAYDLFLGKAVQKLAHPHHVETARNRRLRLEQVSRMGMYPFSSRLTVNVFLQHTDLLRQVHDGNIDISVFGNALQRKSSGIAANIENFGRTPCKHV